MFKVNLDIIIPAYNAKDTIRNTLYSIALQRNVSGFHVYIVNDCSDYDYSDDVSFFSRFFDIKELRLPKNGGPGVARQYGINNSQSEYIMFIDADDFLYSPNSLSNLYKCVIDTKYDMVVSNFIYERDDEVKVMKKNLVWLHGKLYKRNFLFVNDIQFNDTYSNEDNGFNKLALFHIPNIYYSDDITYIYSENENSITRKNNRAHKFDGLEWYCYNINWAINKMLEKNKVVDEFAYACLGVLVSMYYYYLEFYKDYDVEKILKWSKNIKKLYDEYKKDLISFSLILAFLDNKDSEYEGKKIVKRISFFEFLERIDSCD